MWRLMFIAVYELSFSYKLFEILSCGSRFLFYGILFQKMFKPRLGFNIVSVRQYFKGKLIFIL